MPHPAETTPNLPTQFLVLFFWHRFVTGSPTLSQPVAEKFADEITGVFAPHEEQIAARMKKIAKTADRIPALRRWLAEQAKTPKIITATQ
jgi:hypothetical protein